MTVREMLENMGGTRRIVFEENDQSEICTCQSDSKGIIPYLDRKIKYWYTSRQETLFLSKKGEGEPAIYLVLLDEEQSTKLYSGGEVVEEIKGK